MRALAILAASLLGAPALAQDDTRLALPIAMMVDLAESAETDAQSSVAEASGPEIAYGHFQRGAWDEARRAAEPLADAGDGAMAVLLARIYGEGLGVARDRAVAEAWLERAAAAGDPSARHDLAIARIDRDDPNAGDAWAIDTLRALAREGRPDAAFDLAQALLSPGRSEDERAEGSRALRSAADAGLPHAQHALARFLGDTARPNDAEAQGEAVRRLVAAARSGLPEAQMELGDWLLAGRFGLDDREAGRGWIERASRSGLPIAAARLRRMDAASRAASSALPGVEWAARSEVVARSPVGVRSNSID